MNTTQRYKRVLAIYPNAYGAAFVVFEGSLSPIDWGVIEVRGRDRNSRCLQIINRIVERHQPDVFVLRDPSSAGTHRSRRVAKLNAAIVNLAELNDIPIYTYSRTDVRNAFAYLGLANKHAIAEAIAKHIPAFERYVPPPRKLWRTEHFQMGLFDAAALALTFYQQKAKEDGKPPE